ncbi:hypothetical protein [Cupriavidus gilardii]|uniref:Uncharacterized protein n=1 Tax=Cupriavidus gilardii TaxID=82541 RepID=A0A849BJ41_9BURK|nr:hypothetical protein [Cupriavidus gilardii]KAB0592769.1 hypothetical protein F7Q96_26135 [Cupriavidus gilardii]MCT9017139.1 hypothetical protein [Cupriavidus gilardii]MCT9056808.1 hypothetical protein [Cupriavidus gilardii]NNH14316.1 hypothetical protein [Cupriavidus gilardii]UXC37162.1 hypothetical protein N4G38_06870 [Cupriavidus gilardii]
MRIVAVTVLGAFLAGCSYNLELMARGNAKTGSGVATRPGNDVTIVADGVTYKGKFAYMSSGFMGTSTAFSGAATATATAYGSTGQSNGTIIARSEDGRGLRCQFQYSTWSAGGVGMCQDDAGTIYDLQISG